MLPEAENIEIIDERRVSELKEDSTPDDNLFNDLFIIFKSSVKNSLEKLELELEKRDFASIRATAHKIRNSSGNVGAKRMHWLATQLELHCEELDAQILRESLLQLQRTFQISISTLQELL